MLISHSFDSGNIEVLEQSEHSAKLAIRKDNNSDFYQWFHFSVAAKSGEKLNFCISNAGTSAYVEGWEDYNVCFSYDRENWFRAKSSYENGELSFGLSLERDKVWFAYFAPFSYERHQSLIANALEDNRISHEVLGQTVDKRDIDLLKINADKTHLPAIWIIARQHPGESMAEFFIEGVLDALLDYDNPFAKLILQKARLFIVPNMNPDGSVRGHLRTNAVGTNLNREWSSPSLEKSPEVFHVRERMLAEGGAIFLDIHGDEALPYNFIAASEGIPSYNDRISAMEQQFKASYMLATPEFQTTYGYDVDEPGQANLTVASNWMAEQFKTLALTLEMPFKDNADLPNLVEGWSPDRSRKLGEDILLPIHDCLTKFFEE